MILKASQRAGAKQLGLHLTNIQDNEHVTVHQVRGFISDDIVGALREAYAISRGTRCKQFMFSVSLSPPETENVPVKVFEDAINRIEKRMNLTGQPRVVVFHEKEGRRHAHAVWSRIDADSMTAINLPHFKMKLQELSRELYIENKWQMPRGFVKSEERDPLNFSLAEWQQAKRIQRDPKIIKQIFLDCWAISDSLKAFQQAMEARGYYLARGDRRGHVAVDHKGEVYAISKWTDNRAKEVVQKLGDLNQLPTVNEVKITIAERMKVKLSSYEKEVRLEFDTARLDLARKRQNLVMRHRDERSWQQDIQAARHVAESRFRAERFRKGLIGLWDRVTGRHSAIRKQNEAEYEQAKKRDEAERQTLIERQLQEWRQLQHQIKAIRSRHDKQAAMLQSDLRDYTPALKQEFNDSPTYKQGKKLKNARNYL